MEQLGWKSAKTLLLITFFATIADAQPAGIVDLTAAQNAQIRLNWTVPSPQPNAYDIRWSVTGPINTDFDFAASTPLGVPIAGYAISPTADPAPGIAGSTQSLIISELKPRTTYYWAIKSSSDGGVTWSVIDSTSPRPAAQTSSFFVFQELTPLAGGAPSSQNVVWADVNNNGAPDLLTIGTNGINSNGHAYLYANNLSTFTLLQAISPAVGYQSCAAFGDFDNDGKIDLAMSGFDGTNNRLLVFHNQGGSSPFVLVQEPMGSVDGLRSCGIAFADVNNDGRPDLIVGGQDSGGTWRLRIYRNTGGTPPFALDQEVMGPTGTNGLGGPFAVGDYDNNGTLDIIAGGTDNSGNARLLVFRNDNSTFTFVQEPTGAPGNGYNRSVILADLNNDGRLDLAVAGDNNGGHTATLLNTGNAAAPFASPVSLSPVLALASLGAADFNVDGQIDLLANGSTSNGSAVSRDNTSRLVAFLNSSGSLVQGQNAAAAGHGFTTGGLAWADLDNDGAPDFAVSGISGFETNRTTIFRSAEADFGLAHSTPSAPGGLFASLATGGTVQFGWAAGSYEGSFSPNSFYYQVAVATCASSPCISVDPTGFFVTAPGEFIVSPAYGSPFLGAAMRPMLSPGQPGLRLNFNSLPENVTYYFRVATIDSALRRGKWSAETSIYVSEAPAAIVNLSTNPSSSDTQATLTWTAPGNNGNAGTAASYDIRFATFPITSSNFSQATIWNSARSVSGPAGTPESETITGLAPAITYYFAVKTRDPVGNLSALSNVPSYLTGSSIVASIVSMTPSAGADGVSVSTTIIAQFSKTMSTASLNVGFSVVAVFDQSGNAISQLVAGSTNYAVQTLTFTPASPLSKNFTYEVRFTTAVTDLSGIPLTSSVTWRFTTLFDHTVANVVPVAGGYVFSTPANAFPSDGLLSVSTVSPAGFQVATQKLLTSDGYQNPVNVLQIQAVDTTSTPMEPTSAVTLTVPYSDSSGNGTVDGTNPPVRAKTLALWWLDPSVNTWVRLPGSTYNPTARTVTTPIPHFSVFALIGAQDNSLDDAHAYPVPFRPKLGHTKITFTNLAQQVRIRVFTVSGERVADFSDSSGNGSVDWDVRNSAGQDVASGVYFYLLDSPNAKKKGQLVIIR